MSEGHAVVRQQIIVAQAKRGNDRVEVITAETVLGYGVTPDLALFVAVPFVDREFEPATGADRGASGFADIRAFARYTLLRRDLRGRTLRIAPFAGLELPTGSDAKEGEFGLLPAEIDADTGGFLFGGVELNYRDESRSRLAGVPEAGSGGQRLFITPVLQFARKRWIAEAALQIPVTQTPSGPNTGQDHVLRFGLRANL